VNAKREAISDEERACGASTSETTFSLADAPPDVAEFVTSPFLGEIAARFLEVDAVRVFHFVGFFKEAGGPATPLHQDLTYVPLNTDRFVSIWIPLADVTEEMGSLVFAEGSHLGGALKDPSEAFRFKIMRNPPMKVGDISMHIGWTVHGALKNMSDQMREAFVIAYYADGARIEVRGEVRFMQTLMKDYFAGLQPGDLAESPMNPVVYRSNGA
jgi:ectoine hydroxylase-related dioxygenase (phytanoyl-CoA dioxygenase family)